jgi:predicted methyltransferase
MESCVIELPGRAVDVTAGDAFLCTIAEVLADETRPRTHRSRDVRDKTAQLLALLGIRTGQRVVDLLPFKGYFTRLFSTLVGDTGRVFAAVPSDVTRIARIADAKLELEAFAAGRSNVTVISGSAQVAGCPPERIDLFWISMNYHDLESGFMGPLDMARFNSAIYRVLSPGAAYVIVDHSAHPGSPREATSRLHRIDPLTVQRQVESVGFVLGMRSDLLAEPTDPRTNSIFSHGRRYHTDRFILKFTKPA